MPPVGAAEGCDLLRVPSSITAENFYLKLGFRKVRDEFHGAERTIIMERRLTPIVDYQTNITQRL